MTTVDPGTQAGFTARASTWATNRVLVAFGSKRGATAEIAEAIATALRMRGLECDCMPAATVHDLANYDSVVIGGALYMGRWVREARRFVARHRAELRARQVWMFSSGPLDASANQAELPPVKQVLALMASVGARGHATFGGRLTPDAKGFPAAAMARTRAGDWRNWDRVRTWSHHLAEEVLAVPRIEPEPIAQPTWGILATLCLAVGLSAIGGAIPLIAGPDGSSYGMPLSLLEHSPFSSFLIPGLLLLIVIGAGNTIAGALVLRGAANATAAAFAGGTALLTWIVVEMVMLRAAHWLQLGYLGAAIVIMVAAIRRQVRSGSHRAALQPTEACAIGDHRRPPARFGAVAGVAPGRPPAGVAV